MRKIIFAVVVAALPGWAAVAQQTAQQPKKPASPVRTLKSKPCAAYGAGFVKVEGSDTCIKIGGSVGVEVGSQR
jgi:hypothetical protein